MAKLKQSEKVSFVDQVRAMDERMKANSPVVNERWYVVDYYPGRRAPWHDEYNDWIEPSAEIASPYFDTQQEALDWFKTHDPEAGATLVVRHENCRVFTEERWVPW